MSFASIAIKTSIPATAPAATSGALTFSTIEDENWLQITGDASAGSGSLYVLRWNADLAEWRPYMEDKPIAVNSATLNGLFSASYPFPKGEESFVLYDPASAITATASAARTGSPLAAPTPASSGASGGATEAKQDAGNASLASILGQLDSKTSTLATASAQTTGNNSLSSIDSKVATAAKQDTGNTSLATIATQQTDGSQKATVTQGTGSGSAATFWYTRNTDGTNTQPTMDTAARSGFQRITDGTNTAAVKAASTAVVASDPAVAVSFSPNSALPTGDNTIGRTKITDGTSVAAIASGTASAVNAQVVTPNQQQTFVISAQGIAPGNGKSMISLANGSGSGKTIRIQAISFYPVTDSAVAGVNVQFDGFKFTTHASGTSLTPIALDSSNLLSGSVTAQTNATITGSGTIALDSWFQNSDEITSASLTPSAQASIDGQRRRVYGGSEMQPIVVRAGEGFYIKCQTNTTVGAFSVFMWFTQE